MIENQATISCNARARYKIEVQGHADKQIRQGSGCGARPTSKIKEKNGKADAE